MITITYTRNGVEGTKKVHDWAIEETLASFRAYGYTIISDGSTPVPAIEAPAPAAKVATGRTAKGKVIHKLIGGSAACGSSFRRNRLGNAVQVTGEAVTCNNPACR